MVGFKAKARASAYFTKLGWRRGCVFVGGVYVCEGWIHYVYTLLDHCLKSLHNTVKHMNLPNVV